MWGDWSGCFNPHPTRRSGATRLIPLKLLFCVLVSILTRLEGRVQRLRARGYTHSRCFNPHPTRRSGATNGMPRLIPFATFQSSPDSKVGCNSCLAAPFLKASLFQSSPDSKVGCNGKAPNLEARIGYVSILTRLEGRVQQFLRAGNRA